MRISVRIALFFNNITQIRDTIPSRCAKTKVKVVLNNSLCWTLTDDSCCSIDTGLSTLKPVCKY